MEQPDLKITFKVRKNKRTGEWLAYDIVAEGISLLSSKQREFEAIRRTGGIVGAIDIMSKKNCIAMNCQGFYFVLRLL